MSYPPRATRSWDVACSSSLPIAVINETLASCRVKRVGLGQCDMTRVVLISCSPTLLHAVVAVGYSTASKSNKYWMIRNSCESHTRTVNPASSNPACHKRLPGCLLHAAKPAACLDRGSCVHGLWSRSATLMVNANVVLRLVVASSESVPLHVCPFFCSGGTGWGMSGYAQVKMTGTSTGTCGMYQVSWASGSEPDAPSVGGSARGLHA